MPASVGAPEDGAVLRRFAAMDACAAATSGVRSQHVRRVDGNATHGGAGLFLDGGFAIPASAPIGKSKAGLDGFLELVVGIGLVRIRTAKRQRSLKHRLVNLQKQFFDCGG